MNDNPAEHASQQPFEHIEQVGTVELDRYCSNCGYNLRQQAIRRETATKLLLCKCPECGAFEPANTLTTATQSWFRFIVVLVWVLWLVIWLNLVGWSIFGVTGLAAVSGDVGREWNDIRDIEDIDSNRFLNNEEYRNYISQANNPSYQGYSSSHAWDLREMNAETVLIVVMFIAMSFAIGALLTTITSIAMPHWPKWGYVAFACAWPLIGIIILHGLLWREIYNWQIVTVDLHRWHLMVALLIEATALIASLLAVWLGRPISRGIIRVIVPPKRRGVFAYLWLADGKTPPKTV